MQLGNMCGKVRHRSDPKRAVILYLIAYRQGAVRAANHLASIFRKGLGVKRHPSLAYSLYQQTVRAPDTPDIGRTRRIIVLHISGLGIWPKTALASIAISKSRWSDTASVQHGAMPVARRHWIDSVMNRVGKPPPFPITIEKRRYRRNGFRPASGKGTCPETPLDLDFTPGTLRLSQYRVARQPESVKAWRAARTEAPAGAHFFR